MTKFHMRCIKCGGGIFSLTYQLSSKTTRIGVRNRRYCPKCDIVWKIRLEVE